jgi:hypothetical protein
MSEPMQPALRQRKTDQLQPEPAPAPAPARGPPPAVRFDADRKGRVKPFAPALIAIALVVLGTLLHRVPIPPTFIRR